ncbi:hypothetical protein AVEN_136032-1 [Araneus ventricosus]|uniref:Uncharacterized protein n=1 Tax=Araneus ventricosus TaxID=182803 RepID=A0A4Y2ETD4_ARAVE|nr:hypothetical protein AVEN_136032-1 [Araneus ventricosus]
MSAEPLSGADFALPSGTVTDVLFFDDAWTTNTLASTAGVTVIYPLCMNTNNGRSRATYQSCSFGDTRSESSGHYDLSSIKFS